MGWRLAARPHRVRPRGHRKVPPMNTCAQIRGKTKGGAPSVQSLYFFELLRGHPGNTIQHSCSIPWGQYPWSDVEGVPSGVGHGVLEKAQCRLQSCQRRYQLGHALLPCKQPGLPPAPPPKALKIKHQLPQGRGRGVLFPPQHVHSPCRFPQYVV